MRQKKTATPKKSPSCPPERKIRKSAHSEAENFIEIVSQASCAAALTGAGISTESGIPDYRSPEEGLWEKMDQSVVSLDGFMENPASYYSYALELYPVRSRAKPNAGHLLFAELERRGMLEGVITQNVDGLHSEAGSKCVYELHGTLKRASCLDCGAGKTMDEVMQTVVSGEAVPTCGCGGVLKPDAVFFGEPLPSEAWNNAVETVERADVLIVAGSSLLVAPASTLPANALQNGAKLIVLNIMETLYDSRAELVVRDKIAEFSKTALETLKSRDN